MTMTLSRVTAMSISSASSPALMAYSNAGMVFSGRIARAPRCPCTRIRWVSAAGDVTIVRNSSASALNMGSRALRLPAIHVLHGLQIQSNHIADFDKLRHHHLDAVLEPGGVEGRS